MAAAAPRCSHVFQVTPKAPRRRTSSNTAAGGDDLIGDSVCGLGDPKPPHRLHSPPPAASAFCLWPLLSRPACSVAFLI
eukprot:1304291-Prymnesium_polylepis.2